MDEFGDACDADDDNDEVIDSSDNCQYFSNPLQEDLDGDLIGDVCDLDKDGDNANDDVDNCPLLSNADQANMDGDLLGDVMSVIQIKMEIQYQTIWITALLW